MLPAGAKIAYLSVASKLWVFCVCRASIHVQTNFFAKVLDRLIIWPHLSRLLIEYSSRPAPILPADWAPTAAPTLLLGS